MVCWTEKTTEKQKKSVQGSQLLVYWADEKEEHIIKNKAKHEMKKINHMLNAIENYLNHAPEGRLKVQNRRGQSYYYRQYKNDKTTEFSKEYISKKDEHLIKALAQKGYYEKIKP